MLRRYAQCWPEAIGAAGPFGYRVAVALRNRFAGANPNAVPSTLSRGNALFASRNVDDVARFPIAAATSGGESWGNPELSVGPGAVDAAGCDGGGSAIAADAS